MSDVPGKFYIGQIRRSGTSGSSPGFLIGEADPPDPVNPPGSEASNVSLYFDFEPSSGNISFAPLNGRPRKYGFTTALTGNITFSVEGGVENVMIKIRHNSGTAPTFSVVEGGVTLVIEGGTYQTGEDNFIQAVLDKNDAGTANRIRYTITQAQ